MKKKKKCIECGEITDWYSTLIQPLGEWGTDDYIEIEYIICGICSGNGKSLKKFKKLRDAAKKKNKQINKN